MTRKMPPPTEKTPQQIIREALPSAEATLKDALNGVDILDTNLRAAIFVIEMAARMTIH